MAGHFRLSTPVISRVLNRILQNNFRFVASECRPELYGYYPDTVGKHATKEQRILLSRFAGDEHYEPKIFRRGRGTEEDPNVVPIRGKTRLIACTCDPSSHELHYMMIVKGRMEQCPCKFYFKGVDAAQVEFTKEELPSIM